MSNMKHLYFLLSFFFLASCQQEDTLSTVGSGYLSLSSLQTEASAVSVLSTRAVSPDLAIEIWKEGESEPVKKFQPGGAEASGKIELAAGAYTLKAYSENYGTSYGNNEKGAAKYYKEQPFTIEAAKVNYLDVEVPMTNLGVKLVLPESFGEWFTDYTFTVAIGDRTLALRNNEIAYFDVPTTEAKLIYTLSATNQDNEESHLTQTYEGTLRSGVVYEVSYSIATRCFAVRCNGLNTGGTE